MSKDKYKIGTTNYMRQWWRKHPERYLWTAARKRAQRRGLEFSILETDIIIPNKCPILDVELGQVYTSSGHEFSPCLDRIDNKKGYTRDNIAVISFKANRIKGSLSKDQLVRLLIYVS